MAKAKLTPMLEQYLLTKESYQDCILMFRLGDFYEMFFEDAEIASKELEIVLTGRDCGLEKRAPMCGVPYHSVDSYIKRLIEKGYKVAICEQMTDPALSKGLVEREVVRVVTPGTAIDESMVERGQNRYIMSFLSAEDTLAFAWCDVSTGEFNVDQVQSTDVGNELLIQAARVQPAEIVTSEATFAHLQTAFGNCTQLVTTVGDWAFRPSYAFKTLCEQFRVNTLEGFGLDAKAVYVQAAGGLMHYLNQTQKVALTHINRIRCSSQKSVMELDNHTRRNLELTRPMMGTGKKGTLLWVLDRTRTAQGARLLRQWIEQPLLQKHAIEARLTAVETLHGGFALRETLRGCLEQVYDLERLCAKIAYSTLNARDAQAIARTLRQIPAIKEVLAPFTGTLLCELEQDLMPLQALCEKIEVALVDDPPISVKDGGLIRQGYHAELDTLREAYTQGRQWLSSLEAKEREATGIKNLKIGYNKVFGYFFEVTKSQLSQVPYRYVRKQTLVNAERFITDELKSMEESILGAEEKSIRLEYNLFVALREEIAAHMDDLQRTSRAIAQIDVLQSLAHAAYEHDYVRPAINESGGLHIEEGRHPVVEASMSGFVPNDVRMDNVGERFLIITGPNMSGKSTYMRQVAIITLMAHIGSFVPARSADICITDRIFTRVGASDDLASGRSTFMVEMVELANILHNATPNSLIILDEIGRGTSTFDGLSIAWASAEYICDQAHLGAKTLFATHYHELAELEGTLDGVRNYCVLARETGDDILFLHRIVRGGTDKSFGIQVAKLAGVPDDVLTRAREILGQLQALDVDGHIQGERVALQVSASIENATEAAPLQAFAQLDIGRLTPLEALNLLNEYKFRAGRLI